MLDTEAGISIKGFLKVVNGHILTKGTLLGLYGD